MALDVSMYSSGLLEFQCPIFNNIFVAFSTIFLSFHIPCIPTAKFYSLFKPCISFNIEDLA